ncbi:MAG: pseudouridine synthase [Hyphomicrobiales bacterium]
MTSESEKGDRIAKVMARAGLCSRREAERWIADGRVLVNGKRLDSPALNVGTNDDVVVDGKPMPTKERTRLWLYHKPKGLVSSNKDSEGRPTVFANLPKDMPRVISVGRLDINTEGLLLLTNDGSLARHLELPSTGWLRRYRVRAFGRVTQPDLDKLKDGVAIDGVLYGAIEAELEREQGSNAWITIGIREGKNREVKKILEHLGLAVNRLIRTSYGPFQLGDIPTGDVKEIRSRTLRDQLGTSLVSELGLTFEGQEPMPVSPNQPDARRKPVKKVGGGWKAGFSEKASGQTKSGSRNKSKQRDKQADALERLSTSKPGKAKSGSGKPSGRNASSDKRTGAPRADRRR